MPNFDEVHDRLDRPLADALRLPGGRRRLSREPIDDATVLACLDAALAAAIDDAPRVEFVVVRDPEARHQLARIYRQGWSVYKRRVRREGGDLTSRQWEADHFEDAPAIVVACTHGGRPLFPAGMAARFYQPVLAAVQNLVVAAHALGLGAHPTMLAVWSVWEARRTLGLPRHVTPIAVVPLGWPQSASPDPVDTTGTSSAATVSVGTQTHLDRYGHRPFGNPPVR